MDRKKPVVLDHVILKDRQNIPLKMREGHTLKAFAKLYDRPRGLLGKMNKKHSLFFSDMFKSLMGGKSSYVTYMNDSIVGKNKSHVVFPEYVRCVIKEMTSPTLPYYNEVVGSRLANVLGIDAVYNMAHQIDPDYDIAPDDYDYLISVDYLPDGYRDFSMSNIGVEFDIDDSLEDIMVNLYTVLRGLNRNGKINSDIEQFENFGEEFVRQYLYRSLVCEDRDFCSRNVGIMYNKNGDYRMCPCFDMELFFGGARSTSYYQDVAKRDLEFVQETMPDVLEDFLNRCNSALKSGAVSDVMLNGIKANDRNQYSYQLVKNNISKLTIIHQQLKESPEMGNQ